MTPSSKRREDQSRAAHFHQAVERKCWRKEEDGDKDEDGDGDGDEESVLSFIEVAVVVIRAHHDAFILF